MANSKYEESLKELATYRELHISGPYSGGACKERKLLQIERTPLFSWEAKQIAQEILPQYGYLGEGNLPGPTILLNTNTPWSAFICGSQGSGKSHTLSCMLENCLSASPKIGKLPTPLTGIVFHYDPRSTAQVCEAAYLCSADIRVKVLLSPGSHERLEAAYRNLPKADMNLEVHTLRLKSHHLNLSRMKSLMALADKESAPPLYAEMINNFLRQMNVARKPFVFEKFRRDVNNLDLLGNQKQTMNQRLELLEYLMEKPPTPMRNGETTANRVDVLKNDPGTLTIVDLNDPYIDASYACMLFDICLDIFLEINKCDGQNEKGGRVVALDEAHMYMQNGPAADRFTESLIHAIAKERHEGARVIVATQEPTISTKFLDLCSMTFVHRFTSPAWFDTLKGHLAGASTQSGISHDEVRAILNKICKLNVGEALLFSPSALVRVEGGKPTTMNNSYLEFKTRPRLSWDGGQSLLAN
ncbi:hypothetical protein K432DRAFT_435802 [Lepidopterella palustris CBS 459.81]|uniref:AAA+ ATPase domain-containing protein n=1 Tax=Lepidopterella palustris CBS 459.81 TaxID=1314670 RepID=A0A8E2E7B6_9PEZI|nr:hypothetical protein K432DRAFT_435802 [Lepidopterella palustris CBS 459.81]